MKKRIRRNFHSMSQNKQVEGRIASFLQRTKQRPSPPKLSKKVKFGKIDQEIQEINQSIFLIDQQLQDIQQKSKKQDISFGSRNSMISSPKQETSPGSTQNLLVILNQTKLQDSVESAHKFLDKMKQKLGELDVVSSALSNKQIQLKQKLQQIQQRELQVQKRSKQLQSFHLSLQEQKKLLDERSRQIQQYSLQKIEQDLSDAREQLEIKLDEIIKKENQLNQQQEYIVESWKQIKDREAKLRQKQLKYFYLTDSQHLNVCKNVLDEIICCVVQQDLLQKKLEMKKKKSSIENAFGDLQVYFETQNKQKQLEGKMRSFQESKALFEAEIKMKFQLLQEKLVDLHQEEQRIDQKRKFYLRDWDSLIEKYQSIRSAQSTPRTSYHQAQSLDQLNLQNILASLDKLQ